MGNVIWNPKKAKEGLSAKGFVGRIREVEWQARMRCPNGRKNVKDDDGKTVRKCTQIPWDANEATECPSCGTGGEEVKQLHLQIEPLDHEIEGATGAYHEWINSSERKDSKWVAFMEHLLAAGVPVDQEGFTEQKLVGRELLWKPTTLQLGSFKVDDARMPYRMPKDFVATAGGETPAAKVETAKPAGGIKKTGKGAATPLAKLEVELGKGMSKAQLKAFCQAAGIKKDDWAAHQTKLGDSLKIEGEGDEVTYKLVTSGENWD